MCVWGRQGSGETINIGRGTRPAQYNPIQCYIEGGARIRPVQYGYNALRAELISLGMRLIALLPNQPDPWPRRRASSVCDRLCLLVYTCTASITCEGFFILHPTSKISNSPCSCRITKMHMDHCMYGSTEQGNTFWYFMPILVLDLNI